MKTLIEIIKKTQTVIYAELMDCLLIKHENVMNIIRLFTTHSEKR